MRPSVPAPVGVYPVGAQKIVIGVVLGAMWLLATLLVNVWTTGGPNLAIDTGLWPVILFVVFLCKPLPLKWCGWLVVGLGVLLLFLVLMLIRAPQTVIVKVIEPVRFDF